MRCNKKKNTKAKTGAAQARHQEAAAQAKVIRENRPLITLRQGVEEMPEKREEQTTPIYIAQDHPWVEMPSDDSVAEEIRYSLDEIRIG